MSDRTFNDLIKYAEQLPQDCVAAEVALKNAMTPLYATIGATKNADLCAKADSLARDLYNLEVKINAEAQKFVDTVDAYKGLAFLFGNYKIPQLFNPAIDAIVKVLTAAQSLQSNVLAHNPYTLATAKIYIFQFVAAFRQVAALVPEIGAYHLGSFTVVQLLDGLQAIANSI